MEQDTQEYLGDQLSLFPGGYSHIMAEFTVHIYGTSDNVLIGLRLIDHPTGEMIAYQVPVIAADITGTVEVAQRITEIIRFCREQLSPF